LTEIGRLEASKVGNEALRAGLRDQALDDYLAAAPEFPDGNWGALSRQRLAHGIRVVNARKDALEAEREARSELVAAGFDGVVLEERLDGLYADQRILKRFTKPGKRAELAAWIEHLLMQTAEGLPNTTHLVLRGTETRAILVSFSPVTDPRARLNELIDLYRTSRRTPLPLVEESSRLFAEALEHSNVEKAIAVARTQLNRQREWDAYLNYVLGPEDPFLNAAWSEAFQGAASQVYEPLFRHRSEG
jgi:exonuclease V gamma subunit